MSPIRLAATKTSKAMITPSPTFTMKRLLSLSKTTGQAHGGLSASPTTRPKYEVTLHRYTPPSYSETAVRARIERTRFANAHNPCVFVPGRNKVQSPQEAMSSQCDYH